MVRKPTGYSGSWREAEGESLLRIILTAALAAPLLAACAQSSDRSAEEAKLMETSRQWARTTAAGNLDAILDYWTDDALLLQPGQPDVRGKTAIRASIEKSMAIPGFRISWEPKEAHISDSGDLGYMIEQTTVTVPGPDGKPVVNRLRNVTVWRKQSDGSWKNVVDISNAGPGPG